MEPDKIVSKPYEVIRPYTYCPFRTLYDEIRNCPIERYENFRANLEIINNRKFKYAIKTDTWDDIHITENDIYNALRFCKYHQDENLIKEDRKCGCECQCELCTR